MAWVRKACDAGHEFVKLKCRSIVIADGSDDTETTTSDFGTVCSWVSKGYNLGLRLSASKLVSIHRNPNNAWIEFMSANRLDTVSPSADEPLFPMQCLAASPEVALGGHVINQVAADGGDYTIFRREAGDSFADTVCSGVRIAADYIPVDPSEVFVARKGNRRVILDPHTETKDGDPKDIREALEQRWKVDLCQYDMCLNSWMVDFPKLPAWVRKSSGPVDRTGKVPESECSEPAKDRTGSRRADSHLPARGTGSPPPGGHISEDGATATPGVMSNYINVFDGSLSPPPRNPVPRTGTGRKRTTRARPDGKKPNTLHMHPLFEDPADSGTGRRRRTKTEPEGPGPNLEDSSRTKKGEAAQPANRRPSARVSDTSERSTEPQEDCSEKGFPINWTSTELDRKRRFLIAGVIYQGTLIIVYGRPGVGKSFIVLDICVHIATNRDWMGKKTAKVKGKVVYITSESQAAAVNDRRLAFERKYPDLKDAPLGILVHDFDMMTANDRKNDPDELIRQLRDQGPIAMIVFDTMSATMGGASDTSQAATQQYFNTCERIGKALGCAVMVVHHSGKDETKGPRGSSAILGAVDTELLVTDCCVKSLKQRNTDSSSFRLNFAFERVIIGTDEDGNPITSQVPVRIEAPSAEPERTLPKSQEVVMRELFRLSDEEGMSPKAAAMATGAPLFTDMDPDTRIVRLERLVATPRLREMKTSTRNGVIQSLAKQGRIGILRTNVNGQRSAGFVWLENPRRKDSSVKPE